jgi:hypothetical protein
MLVHIVTEAGEEKWINERIIQEIKETDTGYEIIHFNNTITKIRYWRIINADTIK